MNATLSDAAAAHARGSPFATRAQARQAVDMALPMIEAAMREAAVCGSDGLAVVVMDPALSPLEAGFDEAVLVEHAVGEPDRWRADYAGFARAKARLAWEQGRDAACAQATRPQALRRGDRLLWGSVCLDGIVVGVSGAEPWWDEAFATAVAANLRALAQAAHARAVAVGGRSDDAGRPALTSGYA